MRGRRARCSRRRSNARSSLDRPIGDGNEERVDMPAIGSSGRSDSRRRLARAAIAPAIALSTFALCVWVIYFLWPLSTKGMNFLAVLEQLPDQGQYQYFNFMVWLVIASIAAALGLAVTIWPSRGERMQAFSSRRIVEGSLLAFSITASHSWFIGLNVGHWMYKIGPEPDYTPTSYFWYLVFAGWAAMITFVVMISMDISRRPSAVNVANGQILTPDEFE